MTEFTVMYAVLNIKTGTIVKHDMFGKQFFPTEERAEKHVCNDFERVVKIEQV